MAVRVTDKVVRLYPNKYGCYIRLKNPAHKPKDGYFKLEKSHANYETLLSIATMAAMSRKKLTIRTTQDIVSTRHAEISYLVLDWAE